MINIVHNEKYFKYYFSRLPLCFRCVFNNISVIPPLRLIIDKKGHIWPETACQLANERLLSVNFSSMTTKRVYRFSMINDHENFAKAIFPLYIYILLQDYHAISRSWTYSLLYTCIYERLKEWEKKLAQCLSIANVEIFHRFKMTLA
jgi:hypothetical protein